MARVASIKTLEQNVSHLRRMLRRLEAMKVSAPPASMEIPDVKQFGSRLIVNGKVYTPADLDRLAGKKASFQIPAIEQLEKKLQEQEYKLIQRRQAKGRKVKKITALSELEVSHAEEGYELITTAEEIEFAEWLNSGSDGIKKSYYYQIYGATSINKGDIRGFMLWMEMETGKEIKEVADLYGIFSD